MRQTKALKNMWGGERAKYAEIPYESIGPSFAESCHGKRLEKSSFMILGLWKKSLYHRIPPKWSLGILGGPWILPGLNNFEQFQMNTWKSRNLQRRAPKEKSR